MQVQGRRQKIWQLIEVPWDLLIIGGGITGAGILRLATLAGLKALLVEERDFAWGASSRSGKLVHGGLRYLKQGQFNVTRRSVRERELLLREAPGLVQSQGFLLPVYHGQRGLKAALKLGLVAYDLLAGRPHRRNSRQLSGEEVALLLPDLAPGGLDGGFGYFDACTDDARLVLRLIFDSLAQGGAALNYVRATDLLLGKGSMVSGALLEDCTTGSTARARAGAVINATGAWSDKLRAILGKKPLLRPLRGSHLVFPWWRLPLAQGVNLLHPGDGRPLYIFPWEGATLAGTTDLDHREDLAREPAATSGEVNYLLKALNHFFPAFNLGVKDITVTFAGLRPVVSTGCDDPSREPRDMLVTNEDGLLTVTGGKLTTFRLLALVALRAAAKGLPVKTAALYKKSIFSAAKDGITGDKATAQQLRLQGRYGYCPEHLPASPALPGNTISGTPYLWQEVEHAARHEMVVHLDDLLLRRLRLGFLLPDGGTGLLDRAGEIIRPILGWDSSRWREEVTRYFSIKNEAYRGGLT